jgi:hypothetical protein
MLSQSVLIIAILLKIPTKTPIKAIKNRLDKVITRIPKSLRKNVSSK